MPLRRVPGFDGNGSGADSVNVPKVRSTSQEGCREPFGDTVKRLLPLRLGPAAEGPMAMGDPGGAGLGARAGRPPKAQIPLTTPPVR